MKVIFALIVMLVATASTAQTTYIQADKGLEYKIFPKNGSATANNVGKIVQFTQVVSFGDSTVQNSNESGNQFAKIDSISQPLTLNEVLRRMNVGDSAFARISSDTIYVTQCNMAKEQGVTKEQFDTQVPSFFKQKNAYVNFKIRVVKIYSSDSLATLDFKAQEAQRQAYQAKLQQKMQAEQEAKNKGGFASCTQELNTLLGANIKTYQKTKSGAYVQILKQGTGPLCTQGAKAELRYRGTLLNGAEFDGNMDATGKAIDGKPTLPVTVLSGGMIKGFDEGVGMLRKGTKAKIYIPCNLGYGGQSMGPQLPAYSSLIFEVDVVNVVPSTVTKQVKPIIKKPTTKVVTVPKVTTLKKVATTTPTKKKY